jgi:hypothetical protein
VVSFYADEAELIATAAAFIAAGLAAGEPASVIATPQHRSALATALNRSGVDQRVLRDPDRYRVFDAATLLESLFVGGEMVAEQLHAALPAVLGPGRPRVFGEMVALLWAQGDVAAAIRLEQLWNEAAELTSFSLLCSYPTSVLADSSGVAEISRVCAAHDHVAGPGTYAAEHRTSPAAGTRRSDVYLPVPEAVGAARWFVTDALHPADGDLLEDARLLTSEMVTNAVLHGASAFRVHVDTDADRVRITVEDATPHEVVPRQPDRDALTGRGMVIVEALSSRWGCDVVGVGKAVWAELAPVRR